MAKQVSASVPGKLMLMGEHAVVYGHPCIVTAVGQRMQAIVTQLKEERFELEAPEVGITGYQKQLNNIGIGDLTKGARFVEQAIKNFYERYPFQGGIRVETKSEFSSLFGFGSSSASTVCVIAALNKLYGAKMEKREIFDLAYKTVLDIQGKGSGFDVAAGVYGGTLYFTTGGKAIELLKIKSLPIIVGYSGIKADTISLIKQVKSLAQKYPDTIRNVYIEIENLVELARQKISKGDFRAVGELMNLNQGYLEALGVGSSKLADMIYAAREAGAYGAKLSGAGGGDCMIALASQSQRQAVTDAISDAGGDVIEVSTNAEGVRVE